MIRPISQEPMLVSNTTMQIQTQTQEMYAPKPYDHTLPGCGTMDTERSTQPLWKRDIYFTDPKDHWRR